MPIEASSPILLGDTFRRLRLGIHLDEEQARELTSRSLSPSQQCSALAGLALGANLKDFEIEALQHLAEQHPAVAACYPQLDIHITGIAGNSIADANNWNTALVNLQEHMPLGHSLMANIIKHLVLESSSHGFAAAFLMTVCIRGMQDEDIAALTDAMAKSGETFDYRDEPALVGARLVRRYPTGALSEKTALILPALIACARTVVNVCSPFLVARSLGYTGGTWDKLKSIPGFRFPSPGQETISMLAECGIAMAVTQGEANPADRILYAMRSMTGTIESPPLIVSSIASKHICIPVHRLLMDVRYGEGAFLENKAEAMAIGQKLCEVLSGEGVPTLYELTPTSQPTGSAIGNAVEVAEAIAVLHSQQQSGWDERAIDEQRQLVIHFFAMLMSAEFSDKDYDEWKDFAKLQFINGNALVAFSNILKSHGVAEDDVTELLKYPLQKLLSETTPVEIYANKNGKLVRIEQRRLGEIVNCLLGAGGNDFGGEFNSKHGLILQRRIGDDIKKWEPICTLYSSLNTDTKLEQHISSCFIVE